MPASFQARWAAALVGLAAWAIAVPWLAAAVGLELDVATRLEIADHVIPGLVMLAGAALLAIRGSLPGSTVWLGAGAVAFLTGLWITATHVPLIPDALEGSLPGAPPCCISVRGRPFLPWGCGCCCAVSSSAVCRARNERSTLARARARDPR